MNSSEKRILEFVEKNKNKHIYIYGAGRVAKPIAEFLKKMNVHFEGFVVTDRNINKCFELGMPVIEVTDINFPSDEVAFVIGVKRILNDEIKTYLLSLGYNNILEADDNTRNFGGYGKFFYETPMLEITTKIGCKINCRYCPQETFAREYCKSSDADTILSFDTFKKCLDNCPEGMLIEFAGFTEPFLVENCMDMVKYAKESGFKVNIFTTLVGMDQRMLEELVGYEFEEFVLHVPDEEGYANIPINEEYLMMLNTLVKCRKSNGEQFITYACSQGTVPKLIKEHLGGEIRLYVSLTDRAGNLSDAELYGKHGIKGKIRCSLSEKLNHNVLLPDGRVVLCAQDWGMKHVIGNLKDSTFEEIQKSLSMKKILAMMEEHDSDCLCRDCCHVVEYV